MIGRRHLFGLFFVVVIGIAMPAVASAACRAALPDAEALRAAKRDR